MPEGLILSRLMDIQSILTPVWDYLKNILAYKEDTPLLFTQFYFWAFFALVFALFSLFYKRKQLRTVFLLFASLFFYYKTSGLCLLILLFCITSDYFLAQGIYRSRKQSGKTFLLVVSVSVNMALMAYFKYAYFFTDLVNSLLGTEFVVQDVFAIVGNKLAGNPVFNVDKIVLPVGISFYIFQTLSYTIDVFRGKLKPLNNILDYAFYVSFFPQLVAGPIVRASHFIPQIYRDFRLSRMQFGMAVFWILNGLVKKIVLGDYIAINFIDRVFANPLMFSGFENLSALFGYSLQVYADFSGYTDIAIGVALLMGFYLPKNFNSPYKATNASNFWKRWHISLSSWLRDYLYFPLGGNRRATFGTYFWILLIALLVVLMSGDIWVFVLVVFLLGTTGLIIFFENRENSLKAIAAVNLMTVMLLGGLWHGASLNFMIWGGLNGVGILLYKYWKNWSPVLRTFLVCTLFAVVLLWYQYQALPILKILLIWTAVLSVGTLIRLFVSVLEKFRPGLDRFYLFSSKGMGMIWGVIQTFVFITFTRLFFRSGSNLDPAEANRIAWRTARDMIDQIGGRWNLELIPQVVWEYRYFFILLVAGLFVHWLPERFKRRYRINFALMPLWLMALVVVATVFVVYQFASAGLQPFIYFQF